MKTWKRVLLILGVTVVIGAGTVTIWQKDNLEAVRYAASMDQEEILDEIQANEQALERVMEEYSLSGASLSAEDIAKLQNGEMTEEEAIDKLIHGGAAAGSAEDTQQGTAANGTTVKDSQTTSGKGDSGKSSTSTDADVQRQIARMYALKAQYMGQIEGVVASIKAQYNALPASERTASAKQKLISSGLSQVSSLEGQCDSQVAAVVSDLRAALVKAGQDTSIADQVQAAYSREKSLKKAYYASKLG